MAGFEIFASAARAQGPEAQPPCRSFAKAPWRFSPGPTPLTGSTPTSPCERARICPGCTRGCAHRLSPMAAVRLLVCRRRRQELNIFNARRQSCPSARPTDRCHRVRSAVAPPTSTPHASTVPGMCTERWSAHIGQRCRAGDHPRFLAHSPCQAAREAPCLADRRRSSRGV